MKAFLLFITVFAGNYIFAQNSVGIGTTNPQATLDVLRGTAPNGTAAFRGTTNTSNFNLGVNEDTYIRGGKPGSHVILNDLGSGNVGIGTMPQTRLDILGANGWDLVGGEGDFRLGNSTYRLKMGVALGGGGAGAAGLMQYGTVGGFNALALGSQGKNLITLYGNNSVVELANVVGGKVGIGTNAPGFPLNFPNTIGDKISLYGNSGNHYGFGIQGGLLQIHTSAVGEDIAFGYGSSDIFTERMRIKGNGNVGIGVNDPGVKLDISGRMKIRTGTDGEAGIWLNNAANTNIAAFIGLENNNYVGFYGVAAGWKFAMNTQTGALKVNGNEGTAGQVLQSNGGGSSPSWINKPYSFAFNGGGISLDGTTLCANIGGVDGQVISLAQNSTINYQFTIPLFANNGLFGGDSRGAVSVQFLNSSGTVVSNANSQFRVGNSSHVIVVGFGDLPAGNYTIKAKVTRSGTGDGVTLSNAGALGSSPGCNDIPIQTAQLIVQVLPK